jgi:hypothetical protein
MTTGRFMDKKDILGLFLKNGVLLSPEEFDKVDEKNYMNVLKAKTGGSGGSAADVSTPKTGRITCDAFVRACTGRFKLLKDEILRKTDAVSINKGRKVFSEVTLIGRVKDVVQKGFTLEDITGETDVALENGDVKAGDVVGLKGFFREARFFPKQVIWPDIPLGNAPRPFGSRITLTPRVREDMSGVIVCPAGGKAANAVTGFGRFGVVRLAESRPAFVIVAYSPGAEVGEDAAVMMLKKRMIPDDSIIDNAIAEVPGIFWLSGNRRNWVKNYRGVLIVSTDSDSFAEYDGGEVSFGSVAGGPALKA